MIKKLKKDLERINYFEVVLFAWVFSVSSYVIYRMINYSGGGYPSDYRSHVTTALAGTGYSAMVFVIRCFWRIDASGKLFALFMGCIVALTGKVILLLLKTVLDKVRYNNVWQYYLLPALSYSLVFVASICVPTKSAFYLLNDMNGNLIVEGNLIIPSLLTQAWHNSTYLPMRLFGLLALVFFLRLFCIGDKTRKNYALYFFCLLLTNLFKPNFVLAFFPTILLLCVIDSCMNKCICIKKYMSLILLTVASMIPLVYQWCATYAGDNGSGVAFTLTILKNFLKNGRFAWACICCFAFPIIVTLLYVKQYKTDIELTMAWVFEGITLAQRILLIETGPRMMHGNWGWNMMCASLVLFIICLGKLIQLSLDMCRNKCTVSISWALMFLHIANGFMYFGIIYSGGSYGI